MQHTQNIRDFSLAPSEGERVGERGHPKSSIPRACQQTKQHTQNIRDFSLAPSEGERAGERARERGHPKSSIPRACQ